MKRALALLSLAVSGIAAAQLPAAAILHSITIPGIVNVAGRNNTHFVSDLALTNPGEAPVDVLLTFVPAGSLEDQEVSLSPGQTVVFRNVLQELWGGAEVAGAVQLLSEAPLLIRARTYNTATTGTFGVALPAVSDDALLVSGETAHCLWISQSPDGTRDFRTNIAVVFPDAGGGTANVTLFDQNGTSVGTWEFSSDEAGFSQVSVGSISGPLPLGRAEIEVTTGRAVAYA
ncbi:MAG: hypothetical protein ACXWFQ_01915, partial [Thermoanaerobaculia bacterium]